MGYFGQIISQKSLSRTKINYAVCPPLREVKFKNYGHTPILQALATVPVPVTEPGTGHGTGDRAWYRYRISLVVPVPVLVQVRN